MNKNSQRKVGGKLLVFDLETSNLAANRGHIICAAAKWVGKKEVFTWRIDEGKNYGKTAESFYNDSHILQGLLPLIAEADAVMAYYGKGFDVPYVNTRCISNNIPVPAPFTVIDPWETARKYLKLARNDMGSVAALVGATHQKTHLPWASWLLAHYGHKQSIDDLIKYNVNDIKTLEDVYFGLRPLMVNHPYLGYKDGTNPSLRCPACGSSHTHSRGSRYTRSYQVLLRRCSDCGTQMEAGRKRL